MPAYNSFSILSGEDWNVVEKKSTKQKTNTKAAQPSSTVGSKIVSNSKPGIEQQHGSSRFQSHSIAAPRFETHDELGRPLTSEYYRAFQRCLKDNASGDIVLRFHKTDIVKVNSKGDVTLNTGSYYTYTTMCSMNDALQFIDIKIQAKGDVKDPTNWYVTVLSNPGIPYKDHMVVPSRGPQDRERGLEVLSGMQALLESTSQAHGSDKKGYDGSEEVKVSTTTKTGAAGSAAASATAKAAVTPPPPPVASTAPNITPGSAWANKSSLAARLAAESTAKVGASSGSAASPPKPGEFPPLSASAPKTPATATAKDARATPATAASGSSSSSGQSAPVSVAQRAMHAAAADFEPASPPNVPGAGQAALRPVSNTNMHYAPAAPHAAMHSAPSLVPYDHSSSSFFSTSGVDGGPPASFMPSMQVMPGSSFSQVSGFSASGAFGGLMPSTCDDGLHGGASLFSSGAPMRQHSKAIAAIFAQSAGGDDLDDHSLCVVCMHMKSNTILIPCSHCVLCRACADMVVNLTEGQGECPVCRTAVDLVLDVN